MANFTERVARSIGRHFVTLSCIQDHPGQDGTLIHVFSGFLLEVKGEWFYMTAGHILRDVRIALESGSIFDIWRFGDQTAGNRFKDTAVPYAFDIEQWSVLEDADSGLDYATVHIDGLYRSQLEAGGVTALDRNAWGDHLTQHDHWVLAGTPKETVSYDGTAIISSKFVVAPITSTEAPQLAVRRAESKFYAKLANDSERFVNDIDGMSGGPVFSLLQIGDTWKYKVIGIQSSWYPSSRIVAVCPIAMFGEALEPIVEEALQFANTAGNTTNAA